MLVGACTGGTGASTTPSTAASTAPSTAPSTPEASATAGASGSEAPESEGPSAGAGEPTLDELYEEAKAEGGEIVWYAAMPPANADIFIPIFEERFPGMDVQQVDQTAEESLARAVAEKRAGRVVADVFGSQVTVAVEASKQGILLNWSPPEAEAMPEGFKGADWTAADIQSLIIAWNTDQVPETEAPISWDDVADPKWKDGVIAEPDNYHILIALAEGKFGGDKDAAVAFLREVAANNVQFHSGHSNLAELLTAGQAKVCFGCYSHHFPPRIEEGAPVDYALDEGVANIVTASVLDGAPHPKSAQLFVRWALSEEGQQAYATAGRTPALPTVDPELPVRAETLYPVGPEGFAEYPDAQDLWKEIFQLR
jgi:iron(III) transport system substrate-binding protein